MDIETQNLITKQLDILPQEIKEAIFSVDYPKQLQEVVKRNIILIDQAGKLETETTLVMLGLEPLNDYIINLSRELEISAEKATAIAQDVDELIFKNIRESLRKINDESSEEIPEEKELVNGQSREDILGGIENPSSIGAREESVSVSSLKSNSLTPEYPPEKFSNKIDVKKETSLEIPKESMLPIKPQNQEVYLVEEKTIEPYHENLSPIEDIVGEKLTKNVFVPKENIIIEENTKLPQKPAHDPYREPIE
jgi:hypothetical protein